MFVNKHEIIFVLYDGHKYCNNRSTCMVGETLQIEIFTACKVFTITVWLLL